ncbi:MAG: cation diffusion facilitator family transporter [Bdellovibrionales bacterium]
MENSGAFGPQEQKHLRQAAAISVVVGSALMILKFWAYNMTDSTAIYSDAMESIVNVVAALMALFVIWYSIKPMDEDHPYGHGKSEFFSSAFEGGLIAFASLMIIFEAVQAWRLGNTLHRLSDGTWLVLVAGLANLALGLFLKRRGKKLNSIALSASGAHVITDFWTSATLVVSLLLVQWTDWAWLDPVCALFYGGWLAWTGFQLVRESIGGLMDREDPAVLQSLAKVFTDSMQPGIIQIHHVRVIRSGWFHHIDAHVVMPEFWDVFKVHSVIQKFEKDAISNYQYDGEMNFHVDPCRRVYCQVCELKNCPIRQEEFQSPMPVKLEDIRSPVEPARFRRTKRHSGAK